MAAADCAKAPVHIQETQRQKRNDRARKAGRAQDASGDSSRQKRALVRPEMEPGDGARMDGIFCDLEKTKQDLSVVLGTHILQLGTFPGRLYFPVKRKVSGSRTWWRKWPTACDFSTSLCLLLLNSTARGTCVGPNTVNTS